MSVAARAGRTGLGSRLQIRAFEVEGYRLLWTANLAWNVGRWMEQIAVGWLGYELTSAPFLVALLGFYRMVPFFVVGSIGGVVGDRFDRKRLVLILQVGNVACMAAMAGLSASGRLTFDILAAAEIFMGTVTAFDWPSRGALTVDLVGRERVASATAMDASGQNLSRTIGPLLSGALMAALDPAVAFGSLALIYLIGGVLLTRVPRPTLVRIRSRSPGVFRSLAAGFGYALADEVVVGVLAVTIAMNLFFFPYQQMLPVLADVVFHAGSLGLGFLGAADGFGSLVGTLLIATAFGQKRHGLLFWGGSIFGCLAMVGFALTSSFPFALALLGLGGLGRAGFVALQSGLILGRASDEMRGRVMGVLSLAIGTGPFGMLEVGALAQALSAPTSVVMNAALCAVLIVVVAAKLPNFRSA